MAIRFGVSSTVDNRLPKYSNFWDGTAVYEPFTLAGSYDALATYTVPSGGVSTITFAGIPNTYSHLQIRALAKSTRSDSPQATYRVQLNSDSGSNYQYHRILGDGSSVISDGGGGPWTYNYLYNMAASNGSVDSSTFGTAIFDVLDYASTTKNTTLRFLGGYDRNGGGSVSLGSGLWMNTSAVNSISISIDGGSNFIQYSQFSLYGVK